MPREHTQAATRPRTITSIEKDQDKARAWGHRGQAVFGAEGRHPTSLRPPGSPPLLEHQMGPQHLQCHVALEGDLGQPHTWLGAGRGAGSPPAG